MVPVPSRPDYLPRYISLDAAAELLDVDPTTIRGWISAGEITGYRVGKRLVKVDLDELLERMVHRLPAARPAREVPQREVS